MDDKGRHIIADVYGSQALLNRDDMQALLEQAAVKAGAKILGAHFHSFGERSGHTGVLILAESHISVHTWPEYEYAALDIFMCGECEPRKSLDVILRYDPHCQYEINNLNRGLRGGPKRSDEIEKIVESLNQSAPLIKKRLVENAVVADNDEATLGLSELIKFLSLCSVSGSVQTPSVKIDKIWHELILFTQLYQQFCQLHFGRIIHHSPSNNLDKDRLQYKQTLSNYKKRFGTPPLNFWPDVSSTSCGFC
ncbi:MAG: adenosylmethionine decarboxylase [Thiotrichales bacterium]|nr:adenosylmethionine decarboxylase [Thiotrichales bacterium]